MRLLRTELDKERKKSMADEATIRKLQDALNDQAHKAQRDYRVLQDEL